jgi:hypothetical protein
MVDVVEGARLLRIQVELQGLQIPVPAERPHDFDGWFLAVHRASSHVSLFPVTGLQKGTRIGVASDFLFVQR